jgi:hypothetical protein
MVDAPKYQWVAEKAARRKGCAHKEVIGARSYVNRADQFVHLKIDVAA